MKSFDIRCASSKRGISLRVILEAHVVDEWRYDTDAVRTIVEGESVYLDPRSSSGVRATLTPFLLSVVILWCSRYIISGSRHSMDLNSCNTLTTTKALSVIAICFAGQVLGPQRNGAKSRPERKASHLSGRNSLASSPHNASSLCIAHRLMLIICPFWRNMGAFPSGPPPSGSTESFRQVRAAWPTGLWRRRPRVLV